MAEFDERKKQLIEKLMFCNGTENYYTNPNLVFNYTDGVKIFCDIAEAYWLLDIVNSVVKTKPEINEGLSAVKLKVKTDNTAVITFKDGTKIRYKQVIPYTDCPKGEWRFFYENNVFFWHGEY